MNILGEPFQLYLSSTAAQRFQGSDAVYTTHNPDVPGYATVTAQSEGIYIWDLHELHAVASYAVDTHVKFAIPPFSLYVTKDGSRSVITYALVALAPGLPKGQRGRTLWVIRQSVSGSTSASEKTVVPVRCHPVQICGTGHPATPLLLVSQNGSLTLVDERVNAKKELAWDGGRDHVQTFVFSRQSCTFVRDDTHSCSSVAVTCCRTSTTLHVQVVLLGDEITPLGTCDIPIECPPNESDHSILCLTCSPEGVLSSFYSRGTWAVHQLVSLNSSLVATPVFETLHLCRLSTQKGGRTSTGCGPSAVSLGDSLVLLAALVEGTQDISLQLWDLAYGVILATQSTAAPPDFTFVQLRLVVTAEGQVLLTMSPGPRTDKHATQRSSIHIVPVEAHIKSNLATALGKTALTAKWLAPKTSKEREDDESTQIIFTVQEFLAKKNALQAEQVFLKWVESLSSKEAALGFEFVKRMFNLVLTPDQSTKSPYASRITRCLLENAVVSSIMLNGRLITILRERGDWENLMFALTRVVDVSEDELMASAKFLVDRQRKIENAMDIYASEGCAPPLWSYLFACVSYPFSVAPMRLAIRKYLSDAQDLVVILKIIEMWIQGGTELEVEALLKSMAIDTNQSTSKADSPPYPKIITFLHALLDASFVALLQYQPAHEQLRRILSYTEPEIAFIDSLEPLRGTLEPFATAQLLKEKSGETPVEWRKRRKRLDEQASLSVGLYRLEELDI